MGFIEKYIKPKLNEPVKLSVFGEALCLLSIVVVYLLISTLHNGGWVANNYQFLHYQPNMVGNFGVTFLLLIIFFIAQIINIFFMIILFLVRKNKQRKYQVYHIYFYTVLIFSIFMVFISLTPLQEFRSFFVYLDSLFYWFPTIFTNLILFFVALIVDFSINFEERNF